jgi:hypothetical protein
LKAIRDDDMMPEYEQEECPIAQEHEMEKPLSHIFQDMLCWKSPQEVVCMLLSITLFIFLAVIPARAAEVTVGSAKGKAGSEIQLPLSFDKTDNMAGVKIVLTYNQDMLEFLKAEKTESSQGLMHIVNSTVPGRIVLVMAGATGIKGENLVFCNLYFRIKEKLTSAFQAQIRIVEAEAKSDQLKNIQLELRNGVVVIDN